MEKKGRKGSKSFGFLQSLSQSFMTPVAILPLAGLLLGVGAALQTGLLIEQLPWLDSGIWPMVSSVLRESGNIVFSNLGLIFAIGVAMGMSENDGVAGMAAAIGYLIMNKMISVVGNITPEMIMLEENRGKYTTVLGIPTLQMGVFAGILVGLMTAYLFKKFHQQKLPSVLEFFQGKRLVIIVTAVSSIGLGIASLFIWPYIQNGINWVSSNAIESNKFLSMYIYGFANKALIPVGLHHVENVPFWYMFGEYVNKAGEVINGDYNIYFAQLTDGVPITAGLFMSGSYLLKMFALPGAAFAMYRCAKPENRKKAGGLLLSVAFTAFATGITEPIEFMILFAGLPLYGFYVVTAGLAYIVCYIFNIHIALTFAGGLIDFSLLGILQNANNWYLMIPLGMCFFALYYFSFKWMILKFNFKTPGRENAEEIKENEEASIFSAEDSLEKKIISALGKHGNIEKIGACLTRLRITVKDPSLVKKELFTSQLGAAGVMDMGNSLQIVYGTQAQILSDNIKAVLRREVVETIEKSEKLQVESEFRETLLLPLEGEVIGIEEVNDKVFSNELVGPGFAIMPSRNEVRSPVNGTVSLVFDTKHAIGIVSENGEEILIHVGIDTVDLAGEGFDVFVSQGDKISAGQLLMTVNLEYLNQVGMDTTSPIVFPNRLGFKAEWGKESLKKSKSKIDLRFIKK